MSARPSRTFSVTRMTLGEMQRRYFAGYLARFESASWLGAAAALRTAGVEAGAEPSEEAIRALLSHRSTADGQVVVSPQARPRGSVSSETRSYANFKYSAPPQLAARWETADEAEREQLRRALRESVGAGLARATSEYGLDRPSDGSGAVRADGYLAVVTTERPANDQAPLSAEGVIVAIRHPGGQLVAADGDRLLSASAQALAERATTAALTERLRARGAEAAVALPRDVYGKTIDPLNRHRWYLGTELADRIDTQAKQLEPELPDDLEQLAAMRAQEPDPFARLDPKAAAQVLRAQQRRQRVELDAALSGGLADDLRTRAGNTANRPLQQAVGRMKDGFEVARADAQALEAAERARAGKDDPSTWIAEHGEDAARRIAIDRKLAIGHERQLLELIDAERAEPSRQVRRTLGTAPEPGTREHERWGDLVGRLVRERERLPTAPRDLIARAELKRDVARWRADQGLDLASPQRGAATAGFEM